MSAKDRKDKEAQRSGSEGRGPKTFENKPIATRTFTHKQSNYEHTCKLPCRK